MIGASEVVVLVGIVLGVRVEVPGGSEYDAGCVVDLSEEVERIRGMGV